MRLPRYARNDSHFRLSKCHFTLTPIIGNWNGDKVKKQVETGQISIASSGWKQIRIGSLTLRVRRTTNDDADE